jgi:hypothetical protein
MTGTELYEFIAPHLTNRNIGELLNLIVEECVDMRNDFEFGAKQAGLEADTLLYNQYDQLLKKLQEDLKEILE